eukprot:CAMPEP_0198131236 /NCGR_PEP_ID=MMETSP1442-20131203/55718_1 /TAXON_ID= /ORGANISM="Craspedostauros australis, Strain CCMP3328" /LENGTH=70 /DNA_ID=CAMNT_0043792003 /DNA_START=233 /DNA_END=442 /DNA_ORIENTATION=+
MTEVHVLIDQTVHEQQLAAHVRDVVEHGGFAVSVGILGRQTHVPFRVVRVVPIPRRHGGSCNGDVEDVGR